MSIRYTKSSNSLDLKSTSTPTNTMAKQTQSEIEQLIQYARPTNRDLVRRDITQAMNLPVSGLMVKVVPYYYNNGTSKDLLCLYGTVVCQYKGNRYNIPMEIWLQQDHPNVPPMAYVKPTPDMYVSTTSKDVRPDGTVIIPYLKNWRHPHSDLATLINAMSEAFSQSPPVYSGTHVNNRPPTNPTSYPPNPTSYPPNPTSYPPHPTSYPTNPTSYPTNPTSYPTNPTSYSTPYPTNPTSMPIPSGMGMNTGANTSYSYPYGYSQTQQIPQDVYRESMQSAVLTKVRNRLDDTLQISNAQIVSLKKTEQDLIDGDKKIQLLINDAQQQQTQAQHYLTTLQAKTNEMTEATQKMSLSSGKENSVKDDALITSAPVYKQLLQAYAEEHAIQDLLYYLADGLRKESIGLDTYLKHVRELSRKQFMLRATMHRCRQVAALPIK